jgi:hypothetical protein
MKLKEIIKRVNKIKEFEDIVFISDFAENLYMERLAIVFAYSEFKNKDDLDYLLQQIDLAIDELDKAKPNLQKVHEAYNNVFKAK